MLTWHTGGTTPPRALVIDDDEVYATSARMLLHAIGFDPVECVSTLRDGATFLYAMLDREKPQISTLVLIDIIMPIPDCPELEGIILATQVIASMEAGTLHPAHVVVFSSDLTEQRRHEAMAAGCSLAIDKEHLINYTQQLWELANTPPIISTSSAELSGPLTHSMLRQTVRRYATQLYRFLELTPIIQWDSDHVKHLLFSPALLCDEPWHTWIRDRGGIDAILDQLKTVRLAEQQRILLLTILDNPLHWHQLYVQQFHVSQPTRYRHLGALLKSLAIILNSW